MEDLQGNWERISPDWIGVKGGGWGLWGVYNGFFLG
jgi:hypothetical protein